MNDKHYVTRDGLEKLKEELRHGIDVRRKEIADKLKAAIEMGDLSENAAYSDAKDEQAFLEGRIRELENIISNAVVIEDEARASNKTVQLGKKVTIKNGGKEKVFTIVGSNEANPLEGKISNHSPIGQAILGRKLGEEIDIAVPKGVMKYKILKIE